MSIDSVRNFGHSIKRKITATFEGNGNNYPKRHSQSEDTDSPRQQIKREMREMEAEKQLPLPIPPVDLESTQRARSLSLPSMTQKTNRRQRKRELIRKTLSEDYPGLDYLGFHNVLNARYHWYQILWFSILVICLLVGLFTIYRIIREYNENPTATSINVKSVDKLQLPQLTVCPTNAATLDLKKMEANLFANNSQIGGIYSREDVLNFAYFMLAGSGFQKMGSKIMDAQQILRMAQFYDIFRQQQTIQQFFNKFFDKFGLDCRQFFQECHLGDTKLDCCSMFEPVYLIRRGRCFRSVPLYQRNFDELGKLRVQLMQPPEMDGEMPTQEQLIAFLAEQKPQIAPFPRYYLYPNIWTKMRLTAKRVKLFPAEDVCNDEYAGVGKDFCYIEKWLKTYLENPLNCTYPYMDKIRPTELESCHPRILVEHYKDVVETPNYTMHSKIDTKIAYKNASQLPFVYRIDISYNDLQFELIEEVTTVTFAGLIAQIGGQMSLFMGSSILTLTQALIMVIIIFHRIFRANQREGTAVWDASESEQRRNDGNRRKNSKIPQVVVDDEQQNWNLNHRQQKQMEIPTAGIPLAKMDISHRQNNYDGLHPHWKGHQKRKEKEIAL